MTLAFSLAAGVIGLISLVVLDRGGKPGMALVVILFAGLASTPALAGIAHIIFPND